MKKTVFLFASIFLLVSCIPGETPDSPDSRDEQQPHVEITVIPADTLPTEPLSDLYPDPILDFGLSRAHVIERLGSPDRYIKDGIVYANFSMTAPYVMYVFEDDRLSGAGVLVRSSYTKSLAVYLIERYRLVATKSEYYYFINSIAENKPSVRVAVTLSKSRFWIVMYYPGKSTNGHFPDSCYSPDPTILKKLEGLVFLQY